MDRDKEKLLKTGIAGIDKVFGAGSVYIFGKKAPQKVEVFSSGSLAVDEALGIGGFPRGRITEIYGPPGAGKTTICYQTIAEAQKVKEVAAFVDVEYSFDPDYARKLRVNVDELAFSQPDYGEQALQIVETLIKEAGVGIIIVDSVANLVPKSEYDGEIGDSGVGQLARMMTQAVRKLLNVVHHSDAALVFINQVRDVIGSQFPMMDTPGGRMLKHAASVRIEVKRIASLKDGDRVIGNKTKVKIFKNKLSSPYTEGEFDLHFGFGVSREAEVVDYAEKFGLMPKVSKSMYTYNGEQFANGRENARKKLVENPELFEKLRVQIRKMLFEKKEASK